MQAALVAVLWRGIADGAQLSAGQGRLVTTGDMTTGPKEKGLSQNLHEKRNLKTVAPKAGGLQRIGTSDGTFVQTWKRHQKGATVPRTSSVTQFSHTNTHVHTHIYTHALNLKP
jgi:hypothetical protein